MRVAITGSNGFVGSYFEQFLNSRYDVIPIELHQKKETNSDFLETQFINVDVIVHCAAPAHRKVTYEEAYKGNFCLTKVVLESAVRCKVKRIIFLSSINVSMKDYTNLNIFEENVVKYNESFAYTKKMAEDLVEKFSSDGLIQSVILRLPLIYGKNAPGNFRKVTNLIKYKIPLPFGLVNNKRSMVCIENLCDLLLVVLSHPAAINQIFLVADGHDLSTTELLRAVSLAMGKPSRLLPVPTPLLMLGAAILGKREVARRLLGSFQVDISKTRNLLGWEPPISIEEGLRRCFIKD